MEAFAVESDFAEIENLNAISPAAADAAVRKGPTSKATQAASKTVRPDFRDLFDDLMLQNKPKVPVHELLHAAR